MEPERAAAIQTALIKAGYLNGTPSGVWDAESQAAMTRLQAEHGWQTKLVPDSRAIIRLGLGGSGSGVSQAAASPASISPDPAEVNVAASAKKQPHSAD